MAKKTFFEKFQTDKHRVGINQDWEVLFFFWMQMAMLFFDRPTRACDKRVHRAGSQQNKKYSPLPTGQLKACAWRLSQETSRHQLCPRGS